MEKVLKKMNPGTRLYSRKVVRLYPGRRPAPVAPALNPPATIVPKVQMPPQPEAYLKANEFDFF
jgi:hypothetical protein